MGRHTCACRSIGQNTCVLPLEDALEHGTDLIEDFLLRHLRTIDPIEAAVRDSGEVSDINLPQSQSTRCAL
jgi:hypothetical protein